MEKVIPDFLINKIKEQYNEEESTKILNGLKVEKKSSFRINKIKTNLQEIENVLTENQILFSKVNFFDDAFIIEKSDEEKIRNLDIYEDGKIYMQSISSMLPVIVLEPKEKENILDMCAAPRRENVTNSKRYRK